MSGERPQWGVFLFLPSQGLKSSFRPFPDVPRSKTVFQNRFKAKVGTDVSWPVGLMVSGSKVVPFMAA